AAHNPPHGNRTDWRGGLLGRKPPFALFGTSAPDGCIGRRKKRRHKTPPALPHFFGVRRAERGSSPTGVFNFPIPMPLEPAFIGNSEGGHREGSPFYIGSEARKRHLACFGG